VRIAVAVVAAELLDFERAVIEREIRDVESGAGETTP